MIGGMADPFEMIADQIVERIRSRISAKLSDADVAIIRDAVRSDLSQLRESLLEMGYAIVPTGDPPSGKY
jgi:hypothetical protein